jgi:hypothetical protein
MIRPVVLLTVALLAVSDIAPVAGDGPGGGSGAPTRSPFVSLSARVGDGWLQLDTLQPGRTAGVAHSLVLRLPEGQSRHIFRVVAADATQAHVVGLLAAWSVLGGVAWDDVAERLAGAGYSGFRIDVVSSSGPLAWCDDKRTSAACATAQAAFASLVDGAAGLQSSGRAGGLQAAWRTGLLAFGFKIDPTPVPPRDCAVDHLDAAGAVSKSAWVSYQVPVCAGRTIVVRTFSTEDVDLYVRLDDPPTPSIYDLRGYTAFGNETVAYTPPHDGTLIIGVSGYASFASFQVQTADY